MNVFDLFEYNDPDPENEGAEKLRFHLKKNRFKSIDKSKSLHRHSHKLGEQDVEETASMTKGMKSNPEAFKVQEARKPDVNFDIEDIKRLEQIKDLATLKTQAMDLIAKPSAKPMRPEKVEWFRSALEQMNSPIKVIKLMYDLMLSGEGHQVIGSRRSMNPNSYRSRFGEQGVAEGTPNFLDDDFYAYDPETKVIQSTWSHKSVGRRHHEYEAQQKGWQVVSGMRARSLGLLTKTHAGEGYAHGFADPQAPSLQSRRHRDEPDAVNNIEVSINGRKWKVFAGQGTDSSPEFFRQKQKVADMCRRKTETTGKKWTWGVTGAPATNESVANNMNEELEEYLLELELAGYEVLNEEHQMCPECGGIAYNNLVLAEKQDACYSKVKSRYKVWPSAYASGALVRCRKVGAKNWGNKSKK
jgi:hypothetical protein